MTKIEEIIKKKEDGKFVFKPDRIFYDTVKINQKRWGQILRGEVDPTITELKSIAQYFEVNVIQLL